MRKLLVFCMLLMAQSTLLAQADDSIFISKIADEILVSGKIYENLRVLCKTVGGRLSGSPQKYKAEQWGMSTLQAAGADKVYLQECKVPHWERGGKDQAWYTYKDSGGKTVKELLDVLALGNSMGTGKSGLTAPVVYCRNFDDLERQKDNVKGKIVFFNNPFNEKYITPFLAYGESGVYRRSGPARAAKYGAVAVVIRSLTGSAADNNPHTGLTQYDSNYAKIPCAAMGVRDAEKLAGLLQQGKEIQLYYQSNARMLPDTIGHNVIGELTGSSPNEIITIGGHLDSWDPAEGAQDDGAGCVHAIEVLRTLKLLGYKPKHTIRIVLFADEENGGNGGEMYAAKAKASGEQHLFAFESDAGGFTPRGMGFSMSPQQLAKAQGWLPLLLPYGVYQFTMGGGGSDIGPLHQVLKTPVAGLVPDNNRYFDLHHARNDVFENVNRRELELGAINMTALIYLVDKYGL
ncbi:MAG TPA: M20/M25/M40 family metallo-hydrolase [Chitinophagaceae bacterium]|nr:M20/M25/M40 family metallo-hydrolase [Chitinophagaceae bacterium]